MTTAAGIVIGDEILSGKVQDTNTPLLIHRLRALGVALRRIVTVGDLPEEIAEELRRCARRFDYVFTSGGVGPTHDDRTMEGVAFAFGRAVVRHPELEAMVRAHWRDRVNEAALKMAEVPDGARLLPGEPGRLRFPLVAFRNVYILPGVPQLFAEKLAIAERELHGERLALHSVYLSADETEVAAQLIQVEREHPGVKVGSYPRLGVGDYRVRITFEGLTDPLVGAAVKRLLELVAPTFVVRVERGVST